MGWYGHGRRRSPHHPLFGGSYNLHARDEEKVRLEPEDVEFVKSASEAAWTTEGLNALLWNYAVTQMAESGAPCESCAQKLFAALQKEAATQKNPEGVQ